LTARHFRLPRPPLRLHCHPLCPAAAAPPSCSAPRLVPWLSMTRWLMFG
jgi:hypothetical protein